MTPAVVLGTGTTIWTDWAHVPAAARGAVFAINDWIALWPDRVHHGVSHHADKLPHWWALRRRGAGAVTLHASAAAPPGAPPGVTIRAWPHFRTGGSSALLAVRIARALGHDPVYVAGVPLDGGGYVWEAPTGSHKEFARYRQAWIDARAELAGHVVSPSGFLRELLGAPVARAA